MSTLIETLNSLTEQQKALAEQRVALRAQSVEEVKALIAAFEMTPEELGIKVKVTRAKSEKKERKHLPVKYKTPDGITWTGRGNMPTKMKEYLKAHGLNKEDIQVKETATEAPKTE